MRRRSHKKTHKRRKTMRGGFFGAAGAIAPGAMEWKAGSEYGPMVADRAGNTTAWGPPKPGGLPMYGRGRGRRGSKKGGRTVRKRRMRGGGSFGATRAEYRGDGAGGFANYSQGQAKAAPGPNDYRLGAFNDGNKGFGGFKGLFPK
jgi:hypothetical protein